MPLTPVVRERGSVRASLRTLLRTGPWLTVVGFSVLAFARPGIIAGGAVYFALRSLHNPRSRSSCSRSRFTRSSARC
ncbi:hypothetical protein [Micromonospora violae]|uniref:hypothetical protein n=1 Tax=Micromonospora violae TaxID=1278207 RepID=UPI00102BEC16|nr:hypothetical protein [Micromonospora violae]